MTNPEAREEYEAKERRRTFDIAPFVDAMIERGYHRVTNSGGGISREDYKQLWPERVTLPDAYVDRFDRALLVDRTIRVTDLVRLGDIEALADVVHCRDLVARPKHPKTGHPISRYIIFAQFGERHLGKDMEKCARAFLHDEVGFTAIDGLHLPVEYGDYLKRHGVHLLGSAPHPALRLFIHCLGGRSQPVLDVQGMTDSSVNYGVASRGSIVIPVS